MDNQENIRFLAAGSIQNLVIKVVGVGLHFAGQVLLARYLGPDQFGLFAIGWSIFQIFGIVAAFGLDNTIIQFASGFWEGDKLKIRPILHKLNFLGIASSSFIGVIVLLLGKPAASLVGKPELGPVFSSLAFGLPFFVLLRTNSAASRITNRMKYSLFSEEIIRRIVHFLSILVVIWFGLSVADSFIGVVVSYFSGAIAAIYIAYKLFPADASGPIEIDIKTKDLIGYALFVNGISIISAFLLLIDRVLLGILVPVEDAGIYQAAGQLVFLLPIFMVSINSVITPMFKSLHENGNNRDLAHLYKISTRWVTYLALPLVLFYVLFSTEIMDVFYGPAYRGGGGILIFLAFSQLINLGTGPVGQILIMIGFEKDYFRFSLFGLLLNLASSIVLIHYFGYLGAALGSMFGYSLVNGWGLLFLGNQASISIGADLFKKGLISVVITVLGLLFVKWLIPIDSLFLLVGAGIVCYTIFISGLLVQGLDKDDEDLFLALKDGKL